MSLPKPENLVRFLPSLLAGYLLFGVLGWLSDGDPLFSGALRHPFLILVMWAAIRHGSWEGIVTALVGIVLLSFRPSAVNSETSFLLLATALFTGLMADANLKRTRRLRLALGRQGAEALELRENGEVLRASNVDLLQRVEDKDMGLTVIHQVSARLLALSDPQEIVAALVGVTHEFAGAERCSYYRREGFNLRLALAHGWPNIPAEARVLRPSPDPDLLTLAAERMSVQIIRDYPMKARLEPDTAPALLRLLAVPLLHPTRGEVLGVLSIESLPFVRFNTATVQLMLAIAELGAKALEQAQQPAVPALAAPALEEAEGLVGAALFQTRLRREVLARRRGAVPPFAVLWLTCEGLQLLPPDAQRMTLRAVEVLLTVNLRPGDARAQTDGESFAVLMSDTEAQTAEALATDLGWQLHELLPSWVPAARELRVRLGWAGASLDGEAETILERAQERSQLWTTATLALAS